METVAQIDQRIEQVKKTLDKLEGDKQKNLALLETAKSAREKNALAALSADDTKAHDKLAKARSAQRELELLIEDAGFAIAAVNHQLEALYVAREEAYRAELWIEFQKFVKQALDEARDLSGYLMGLSDLLIKHADTLRHVMNVMGALGLPTMNLGLKHFRWFMYAELHKALPFEFGRGATGSAEAVEVYSKGRYDEFLEDKLDSISNRGAEPQTNAVEKVA